MMVCGTLLACCMVVGHRQFSDTRRSWTALAPHAPCWQPAICATAHWYSHRGSVMRFPTVLALASDLSAGRTTSRRLVEQCLTRINDPKGEGARAFTKVYADAALAEADASDKLRALGVVRSPVEGIPISVKDLFDVAGDRTLAGSKALRTAAPAIGGHHHP